MTTFIGSSRRYLFIDMVVLKFTFKHKLITLLFRFTSIPKTGMGLPKSGIIFFLYYQSKRYCPVLVAQEGSALWGSTLATTLLHDLNRTIPFGVMDPVFHSLKQRTGGKRIQIKVGNAKFFDCCPRKSTASIFRARA